MNALKNPEVRFPDGHAFDLKALEAFERGLKTEDLERSTIPCRVLGYGEISTVLEIHDDSLQGLAFKRMSIFETTAELDAYLVSYEEYNDLLQGKIGVHLPEYGYAAVLFKDARPILYLIQRKLLPASIGSKALHALEPEGVSALIQAILCELIKVWEFNQQNPQDRVAIDGQISNWAIQGFDPQNPRIPERAQLFYIDTSTPIYSKNGEEQLDPELFLRSGPSFLAGIIRLFFLEDVMTRYYDLRKVIIDLLANFYKEEKADLIPAQLKTVNDFLAAQVPEAGITPIYEKEVRNYYREDRIIWVLYLFMRRVDRFLHNRILRREYPYILPGKIRR